MKTILFSAFPLVLLMGCTSQLKKDCEAKNWFQHGYDIAMTGKRVSGDPFIASCKKEEATIKHSDISLGFQAGMQAYCNPKTSYKMGRDGTRLGVGDLCTPAMTKRMEKSHAEGLAVFCSPKNGEKVGRSGRVYDKVCPSALETDFLPAYQRGRKKYLSGVLQVTRKKIVSRKRQLNKERLALNRAQNSFNRFRPVYNTKRIRKTDAEGNDSWETKKEETFESQSQRRRLRREVNRQQTLVSQSQQKITDWEKLAHDTELELQTQH